MKNEKVLLNDEAISRLKSLAEEIKICMFCSELNTLPIKTIPLCINQVDDKGNIWFISSSSNNRNFVSTKSESVQLFFSCLSDSIFLSVFGEVKIYSDISEVENIWDAVGKAWFEESINDSNVKVIKVSPTDVFYWDANENKISLEINSKNTSKKSEVNYEKVSISA